LLQSLEEQLQGQRAVFATRKGQDPRAIIRCHVSGLDVGLNLIA
jgi:hypothetical protein